MFVQLKRYLLVLFVVVNLIVTHLVSMDIMAQELLANQCRLKLGWTSWPPYIGRDLQGKMFGLQYDLYQAIANKANCQFDYREDTWVELIQGIKTGKFDLIGNATITPARNQYAHFSIPYRPETFALYILVRKSEQFKQKNLRQLFKQGFVLAITRANYYGPNLDKLINNPEFSQNFKIYERSSESYKALIKGEVDGFFDDPLIFAYSARIMGVDQLMQRHKVIVNKADVSLMFSKKTVKKETIEQINRAIRLVRESDDYRRYWQW